MRCYVSQVAWTGVPLCSPGKAAGTVAAAMQDACRQSKSWQSCSGAARLAGAATVVAATA